MADITGDGMNDSEKRYACVDFAGIRPVACPCGFSRRAYIAESDQRVSFHVVEIREDARTHYHRNLLEIYYVLEGSGTLEVDDDSIELTPGKSVLIHPFCRHRARGALRIVNVSLPAFDPDDEFFD